MAKLKGGAISNEDRRFILEHMNTMSVEDIAAKIGKHPAVVEKIIRSCIVLPKAENNDVRWHLKRSNYWKHLKEGFSEIELNYIEDQYVKYIEQFEGNVVATEEVQVLDLIKIEVLQQRNLTAKQKIVENLNNYSKMVEDIESANQGNFADLTEEERNLIMDLKNKEQSCMQAEAARTTEYLALQKEKDELSKRIMGSRDQRVQEILNNKVSFTGYIKQLLQRDKQEKESRFIQLYNKSAEKELNKLAQPYTYADKQIDNPILSAEVIDLLDGPNNEDNSTQ